MAMARKAVPNLGSAEANKHGLFYILESNSHQCENTRKRKDVVFFHFLVGPSSRLSRLYTMQEF
jgi:hypothetical protein